MSVDSVFVHKMWNDHELSKMVKGGIPFPMLSDGGGKVGDVFGVYLQDAGVEARGRFIIDPDGIIQGFEVLTPRSDATSWKASVRFRPSSKCARPKAPKPRPPVGNPANPPSNPVQIWLGRSGKSGKQAWLLINNPVKIRSGRQDNRPPASYTLHIFRSNICDRLN